MEGALITEMPEYDRARLTKANSAAHLACGSLIDDHGWSEAAANGAYLSCPEEKHAFYMGSHTDCSFRLHSSRSFP